MLARNFSCKYQESSVVQTGSTLCIHPFSPFCEAFLTEIILSCPSKTSQFLQIDYTIFSGTLQRNAGSAGTKEWGYFPAVFPEAELHLECNRLQIYKDASSVFVEDYCLLFQAFFYLDFRIAKILFV